MSSDIISYSYTVFKNLSYRLRSILKHHDFESFDFTFWMKKHATKGILMQNLQYCSQL